MSPRRVFKTSAAFLFALGVLFHSYIGLQKLRQARVGANVSYRYFPTLFFKKNKKNESFKT